MGKNGYQDHMWLKDWPWLVSVVFAALLAFCLSYRTNSSIFDSERDRQNVSAWDIILPRFSGARLRRRQPRGQRQLQLVWKSVLGQSLTTSNA